MLAVCMYVKELSQSTTVAHTAHARAAVVRDQSAYAENLHDLIKSLFGSAPSEKGTQVHMRVSINASLSMIIQYAPASSEWAITKTMLGMPVS